jgi:ribA/ribD-fused uncharacterized protein
LTEPIRQFRGRYRFLSNFFIEPDGTCVEVEYQQAKCQYTRDRERFVGLRPGAAKQLGRKVPLRTGWGSGDLPGLRVTVMRRLVFKKFRDHPELRARLLATGNAELIEGNTWRDGFWGVTFSGYGSGQNWLGKILMEAREYFQSKARRDR